MSCPLSSAGTRGRGPERHPEWVTGSWPQPPSSSVSPPCATSHHPQLFLAAKSSHPPGGLAMPPPGPLDKKSPNWPASRLLLASSPPPSPPAICSTQSQSDHLFLPGQAPNGTLYLLLSILYISEVSLPPRSLPRTASLLPLRRPHGCIHHAVFYVPGPRGLTAFSRPPPSVSLHPPWCPGESLVKQRLRFAG